MDSGRGRGEGSCGRGGGVDGEEGPKVGDQGGCKGSGRVVLIFDSLLISLYFSQTIILISMSDYCILVRCPYSAVITGVIVCQ